MHIDLHCHSLHSDGLMSVEELIEHAHSRGLEIMALTDHDTVSGLSEASHLAQQHQIRLINGIEISSSWDKHGVHILGLDIDPQHPELTRLLNKIQSTREQRSEDIAERLQARGIANALNHTLAEAGHKRLTRSHFARMLVNQGHCKTSKQAFKRYLAHGQAAYVKTAWPPISEVIDTIHAAGGQAVLAHPLSYKISPKQRRELLAEFSEAGGDGLEVSCGSAQTAQKLEQAATLARDHDLMASQGSDLHAIDQAWLRFGSLMPLPTDLVPVWTAFRQAPLPRAL